MLKKEVASLLNEQVNREFFSAYLYLDISNYFESQNLSGFAHWFNVQAQEERDHAMLFLKYLQNNSEAVTLAAIQAPGVSYANYKEPLEASLEHEKKVSAWIDDIYSAALAAREFRTIQFLDWFVKEQVEEEKNSEDLIRKYQLFGSDGKGLYLMNNELSTRIYAAPTLVI